MARIRSIKPEFPQSESMGRVSRHARLLFIEIWTICDDEGRTRAASRMLASLLFPYDDDAPGLIDGWLEELERERCVMRYEVDGATYLQVCNWLSHQKIDKPSKSKIPSFDETSRNLAKPREASSEDQGSRIKDQGSRKGIGRGVPPTGGTTPKFTDADKLIACEILDGVKTVAPSSNPNLDKWAETVRLMRERDKRSYEQIREMFAWANSHSFWRTNILSPEKLRDKWTTLEAQKRSPTRGEMKTRQQMADERSRQAVDEFVGSGRVIEGERV